MLGRGLGCLLRRGCRVCVGYGTVQYKHVTLGTRIIDDLAGALELPLLVRSVGFFFTHLSPSIQRGKFWTS